ncbi:adenosine deaminase [Brevibacterium casei]|uniref:Adenosine deaminase n=1 Tax=Brevibacterium casei CIP 102111 TaxID=1255625 RepID=A0A2H1IR09_9MICO|nr:adenosine deaminase [Brevibacterium casei]QPR39765.1 adenosine deaminase [Brevibacterium casei]QPR43929.1 adenosine deaminase [Brevibacterium casei]SMX77588.1 adenosine deaminase [Brevibacterium casei CIP 102111]
MTDPLVSLPKAHLHLHFTGSMSADTLQDLAAEAGVSLSDQLFADKVTGLSPDERGWFRFQRLYDMARGVVRGEDIMRRLVREAAAADRAEGSRWLELQVDPTSYAPFVGGITPALEIILDEAAKASDDDFGMAIIVAASRTRHPLDARMLARLAAHHAGEGPGTVIGFGLSNDERRGETAEFARAFDTARRAGLLSVPHGGELLGPEHIRSVVRDLSPDRLGHGIRAGEDPQLLGEIVEAGVGFEVCPGSNVSLGVYPDIDEVPLRTLLDAGAKVALGADDPLIFHTRLVDQYRFAEQLGLTAGDLAGLARDSFAISAAPESVREAAQADIDAWLEDRTTA